MNQSLQEKIRACKTLPSLPATALAVLKITSETETGLDELAKTVQQDAALCTKLLVAVNSRFYHLEHKVSSITQAVALLGMNAVKTLVLGFSLVSSYRTREGGGFNHLNFWRRSMYAATAAREIACRFLPKRSEECFIAALLMDLGTLVLDQLLGAHYSNIYGRAETHGDLRILETHSLGTTHADVAGLLAEEWKLPEILRVPITAHHGPNEVEGLELRHVSEIICLAGWIADIFMTPSAEMIAAVRRQFHELYKVDAVTADRLLCEIGRRTSDLAPLFDVRLNTDVNYDDMVAKASDQLLQITLQERAETTANANRRKTPRIQKNGSVRIIECEHGVLQRPVTVKIRDVSATGIGIFHSKPIEEGKQFLVELSDAVTGGNKSLLYTVKRCSSCAGIYSIGCELTSVLRTERVPTDPSGVMAAAALAAAAGNGGRGAGATAPPAREKLRRLRSRARQAK
jgi:HD-like signal output (HDOD) protein